MVKAQGLLGTAVVMMAFTALPANAATIIQTFTLASNGTTSANVLQFDTTLGELLSVDFGVSSVRSQSRVENPQQTTGLETANFSLESMIGLTSANLDAPALPSFTDTFDMVRPTSNSGFIFSNNAFPDQSVNITSNLDGFKGSSTLIYNLAHDIKVIGADVPYGETSQRFASGNFSITYNFKEAVAAVPEPATWAMMIVGFGLVGAAMRRRAHPSVSLAA